MILAADFLICEKIINFVKHRLHEENIVVKDIVICGYLLKDGRSYI